MDTKNKKRRIDDETVDRLVENRVPHHNVKKKKAKKKKKNLSVLIVLLSAVLVFVIFFVGAYIFFTATSSSDIEEAPIVETDNKIEEKNELPKENITKVEEDEEEKEEEIEGEMLLERPNVPKPSKNPTIIEDITEEKEDTKKEKIKEEEKKPQEPQPKPQEPVNSAPKEELVEKNEDSEAIVID